MDPVQRQSRAFNRYYRLQVWFVVLPVVVGLIVFAALLVWLL